MSEALARKAESAEPFDPWGKANPLRGRNYVEAALAFHESYPVGSALSVEAFDKWAHQHGYLNYPEGAPRGSDVWLAHLQRRHQLRYSINKAAAHPRMTESGAKPYTIDTMASGTLEVRAVHTAIGKNALPKKIASLLVTRRRQLDYLLQSTDFASLPAYERTVAETLRDDITMFERMVNLQADGLTDKFARLEGKIRRAIEAGTVKPVNGGLKAITDGTEQDDENANGDTPAA